MKRALLLVMGALSVGCGPSLNGLIEGKHYREAVCAAQDGSRADKDEVARALARDSGTVIHVHAITNDELRPLLKDPAAALPTQSRFMRIVASTNFMPVDEMTLELRLHPASVADARPVSWESLARATAEKLPPKVKNVSYLTGENILAVITLGLSLPFTGVTRNVVEYDAPFSEFLRLAPNATALHGEMESECIAANARGGTLGGRCRGFFVVDGRSAADLELEVVTRYGSNRVNKEKCEVVASSMVPLGQLGELDARTAAIFGDRARTLPEIEQRAREASNAKAHP